ncbi:thiolase family protein [Geodermatophilus sabuli]|uniref:Acetyl-CoA acyltransferase n=1 Tax=Geodermatophilus sabuli TaxID=1564158 RepID=A0A285E6I8_9ACTN|nr:thiolase family protein [Geodermatophilus sabuli]MBB3082503.1 acetyl-CoA acyltransferase [Geodermatophilus sabuli]SNX94627.1 acetyl-CoA acyltransferase [Geodermatophilus sabuli]
MTDAVIVDVLRTASGRGKQGGALSDVHPADLYATVLRSLVDRHGLDPGLVDDVITGCVSQVGDQGLNIGRTATLVAGFPEHVPATTIDRQCGSSQQAMHFAAQGVMSGAYDIVVAGGVESMSRVPMFSNAAGGDPFGPLSARYPEGLVGQGIGAEIIAARWGLSRQQLDEYAARSHALATTNAGSGAFASEIVPIDVEGGQHTGDETIRASTTVEGLAGLKPSFYDEELGQRFPEIEWSITPGNSSPLTDGASAALIMSDERARQLGLRPRARFHSSSVTGSDPMLMLTGVIPATEKALKRSGLSIDDIDAFEVNEAFAPVPLAWAKELGVDMTKLNPRGGAIALGHPLGASGTRLMTTLLGHLEATGGRYGLQTMCEGGGMANATVIEVL